MMERFPVLVLPPDYPLDMDALQRCWNCGSDILRVVNEWAILKETKKRNKIPLRIVVSSINLFCSVCGKSVVGYDFYCKRQIEQSEFATREEASIFYIERELHSLNELAKKKD